MPIEHPIITVIALVLLYVYVIIRSDTHRFVTRTYEIKSPKLKEDMTLCFLSDLHEHDYDYGKHNDSLVKAIKDAHPDLILSGGDLLTSHKNPKSARPAEAVTLLQKLRHVAPIYLINGNHEIKIRERSSYGNMYQEYANQVKETGARLLQNESVRLSFQDVSSDTSATDKKNNASDSNNSVSEPFALYGLETGLIYYTHGKDRRDMSTSDLNEKLGKAPEGLFTILLAHDPHPFEEYAQWGADLTLAGHMHGGVADIGVGVISPRYKLFPFYDGGLFIKTNANQKVIRQHAPGVVYLENGSRAMVLGRGLGTHTIHVRFHNPGELVVVKLYADNNRNVEQL